jgi:mannosyltransferase
VTEQDKILTLPRPSPPGGIAFGAPGRAAEPPAEYIPASDTDPAPNGSSTDLRSTDGTGSVGVARSVMNPAEYPIVDPTTGLDVLDGLDGEPAPDDLADDEVAALALADRIVSSDSSIGEELSEVRRSRREAALGQLAWLASTLLMGVIGILRVGWPGLWGDELATWGMTTVPWNQMWTMTQGSDVVLAPYYLLIRGWSQLVGDSDLMLRMPSVLAMAGAAGLVAAIGSRLSSARIGLLAGLVFAVLPTTSRYAQEARPYALVVFMAALSTLLLLRLLDARTAGRAGVRAIAYLLAVAALGALHPVAIAILGAHVLAVLFLRPKSIAYWLPAAVLGAAPAGWLLWLGQRQKQQISWIPLVTVRDLTSYPDRFFGTALIGGLLLALALLAVSFKRPAVVYSMWALLPTAVVFAAGMYTPLWTIRYVLFTLPAWALLGATALGRAPLVRGVLAIIAVALLALPHQLDVRTLAGHGQDTRAAAATLNQLGRPTDGILYGTPTEGRVGRDLVAHYVPVANRPRDVLATRAPRTGGGVQVPECTNLYRCIGTTGRLWVFRLGETDDPLGGMDEATLQYLGSYDVLQVWHPDGLTLALLSRRAR